MSRIHANNFSTTLNGGIDDSTTSVVVTSVTNFPSVGGGVTCNISVQNGATVEIMTVTAISSFTLTVVRGAESTTPAIFSDGSTVEIRATAGSIDTKQDILSGASLSTATVATGDKVLIQDVSDSSNLKTVTTQSIADLAAPAESVITFTDITTNNASTSKHGFLKKLSNNATEYMDGTGSWSTPSGGGGGSGDLIKLATLTASTSSSLPFVSGEISSSYTNYVLKIQSLVMSNTSAYPEIQVSFDGGSSWKNTNSYIISGTHIVSAFTTVNGYNNTNTDGWELTFQQACALIDGTVNFHAPANAHPICNWHITTYNAGDIRNCVGGGTFNDGTSPPINAIRVIPAAGNFTSGTVSLYGYNP